MPLARSSPIRKETLDLLADRANSLADMPGKPYEFPSSGRLLLDSWFAELRRMEINAMNFLRDNGRSNETYISGPWVVARFDSGPIGVPLPEQERDMVYYFPEPTGDGVRQLEILSPPNVVIIGQQSFDIGSQVIGAVGGAVVASDAIHPEKVCYKIAIPNNRFANSINGFTPSTLRVRPSAAIAIPGGTWVAKTTPISGLNLNPTTAVDLGGGFGSPVYWHGSNFVPGDGYYAVDEGLRLESHSYNRSILSALRPYALNALAEHPPFGGHPENVNPITLEADGITRQSFITPSRAVEFGVPSWPTVPRHAEHSESFFGPGAPEGESLPITQGSVLQLSKLGIIQLELKRIGTAVLIGREGIDYSIDADTGAVTILSGSRLHTTGFDHIVATYTFTQPPTPIAPFYFLDGDERHLNQNGGQIIFKATACRCPQKAGSFKGNDYFFKSTTVADEITFGYVRNGQLIPLATETPLALGVGIPSAQTTMRWIVLKPTKLVYTSSTKMIIHVMAAHPRNSGGSEDFTFLTEFYNETEAVLNLLT